MKTLYFEGAGMDYTPNEKSDMGNYRIRTAFLNNEGKSIYLEVSGHEFTEKVKSKKINVWKSHICFAFYIPENEEEKTHYLQIPYNSIGYTKEKLTKWINENFNCSFDTVEVLPWLEGYRVHGDNRTYNIINNHSVNIKRAEAREKAYKEIDQHFRQKLNERYSVVSLLKMDNNSITVRCHASQQVIQRAGLTDSDRVIIKEVNT